MNQEGLEARTAELQAAVEAQTALLESLILTLRTRKLADEATVDAVFAGARAKFAKPDMAMSSGHTTHRALLVLEEMQTRVVGHARAMS
jgi:hypothetical protein